MHASWFWFSGKYISFVINLRRSLEEESWTSNVLSDVPRLPPNEYYLAPSSKLLKSRTEKPVFPPLHFYVLSVSFFRQIMSWLFLLLLWTPSIALYRFLIFKNTTSLSQPR